MNIEYKENVIPDEEDLLYLYNNVGWSNYINHSDMLKKAYKNSLFVLTAWNEAKLVGAIRIVGDGYSIIYIQDILVLKEYQHMGIGTKLLSEVLNKYNHVYQKVLLTDNDPKNKELYDKLGFKACDNYGCISFVKYNSCFRIGE